MMLYDIQREGDAGRHYTDSSDGFGGVPMAISGNLGDALPVDDRELTPPRLTLRPRVDHLVVSISGRATRAGHAPLQVAIPLEFHRRLRFETLGSTNQVIVALVRQALVWLDTDDLRLRAEPHPGPIPTSLDAARAVPSDLVGEARRDFERSLDDLWPNPRLTVERREGALVVLQDERQPRVDAQLTQIALPKEVLRRLQHDGVGAVSQLVISLARYAMRRLDDEKLCLDVVPQPSRVSEVETLPAHAVAQAGRGTSLGSRMTVGVLMRELSKHPRDAYVVFEEREDCLWDLEKVEAAHLGPDNPYERPLQPGEFAEADTLLVLIKGSLPDDYEHADDVAS